MEEKPRVLVVEDDKSWQGIYAEALSKRGYSVQTAGSLGDALEALNCRFFHVAIVDLKLTDDEDNRDGMEVLRRIWALDEGTLAIVGSGYAELAMYDEFRRTGIFGLTEIPTEARKAFQSIEFYKGQIKKNDPLHDILDKVDRAVAEALPKAIRLRWGASPFAILKGISAREVQQALRVGSMIELRPFLSSLVQPLFPWLLAKKMASPIKEDTEDGNSKILAFEALCWSRALGKAVVVRFGRRDGFQKASGLVSIGSQWKDATVNEELSHPSSPHFEGIVYSLSNVAFDQHFDGPTVKRTSSSYVPSA